MELHCRLRGDLAAAALGRAVDRGTALAAASMDTLLEVRLQRGHEHFLLSLDPLPTSGARSEFEKRSRNGHFRTRVQDISVVLVASILEYKRGCEMFFETVLWLTL